MVIVPKGEINHFKQSSIALYVGEYSRLVALRSIF